MTEPSAPYAEATRRIDAVELALRRLGRWQDTPLPPEKLQFALAFGADTMAFEQWLQFVLIPRVREVIATKGRFPASSQTVVHAARTFDGDTAAAPLLDALGDFDALFAPAAAPSASHDELVAGLVASGAITAQELTVRGMLIAVQARNEQAARNHLLSSQRNDESLHLDPPFEIYDFQVGRPHLHAGMAGAPPFAVVQATALGTGPDGQRVEQPLPFVLLEEAGQWKIDLHRSMGLMMTGDPHGGMQQLEAAMQQAMQEMAQGLGTALAGAAAVVQGALGAAAPTTLEQHLPAEIATQLAHCAGKPLAIDVAWSQLAPTPEAAAELENLLGRDLRFAFEYMHAEDLMRLLEGVDRIEVRGSGLAAEHGVFREPPALRLCVDPGAFLCFSSSSVLTGWLTLQADPRTQASVNLAGAVLGSLTDALRGRFDLHCRCEADWELLARCGDVAAVAAALQQLGEHGIEEFGAALMAVLTDDPRLVTWAREHLHALRLAPSHPPDAAGVSATGAGEITWSLPLDSGAHAPWSGDRLTAAVGQALRESMSTDS